MMTFLVFLILTSNQAEAYVYLAPQRPRIMPEDGRTQYFYLTSQTPVFPDKDTFEGGFYSSFSDDETFALLVDRAMNFWNGIPELSVQLAIGEERKGVIDADDNLFSIGIGKINSVASGLAFPAVDVKDTQRLRDCDIQLGTDIVSIPAFIFVMVHEFGHCLGLGHNHSDPDAIMSYWQPRTVVALSLDDMAGVLSLYPPKSSGNVNNFAPCGSVAAAYRESQADGRFVKGPKQRKAMALQGILLSLPLLWALFHAITSWSFRRRRQSFVR